MYDASHPACEWHLMVWRWQGAQAPLSVVHTQTSNNRIYNCKCCSIKYTVIAEWNIMAMRTIDMEADGIFHIVCALWATEPAATIYTSNYMYRVHGYRKLTNTDHSDPLPILLPINQEWNHLNFAICHNWGSLKHGISQCFNGFNDKVLLQRPVTPNPGPWATISPCQWSEQVCTKERTRVYICFSSNGLAHCWAESDRV